MALSLDGLPETPPPTAPVGRRVQASLVFARGGGTTVLSRQVVPYPFHITRAFRMHPESPDLATLYLQSASGGLYAADHLTLDIAARPAPRLVGRGGEDEAICRSIISLAAAVGASSVGEGVETAEQYAVLRSKGCRHGQGFLWSPAVPIGQLGTALAAGDRVPVPRPRPRMPQTFAALDPRVETVMATMQAEGASLHTIAAALNRTVGLHPKGVRWTAGAVARSVGIAQPGFVDEVFERVLEMLRHVLPDTFGPPSGSHT